MPTLDDAILQVRWVMDSAQAEYKRCRKRKDLVGEASDITIAEYNRALDASKQVPCDTTGRPIPTNADWPTRIGADGLAPYGMRVTYSNIVEYCTDILSILGDDIPPLPSLG